MIDPALRQKVEQAARLAAQRARQLDLDDWWVRITAAGRSRLLAARLPKAEERRWAGAAPTAEPVDLRRATDARPPDTLGIDGSQVYPELRAPFSWAYVQAVGYRKGHPPLFACRFVDIGRELAEGGELAAALFEQVFSRTALVDAWRAQLELGLAVRSLRQEPELLALLDGGLLPWMGITGNAGRQHLEQHLRSFLRLRSRLVAGVISGPQSRLLVRLVHLAEAATLDDALAETEGPSDTDLMRRHLQTGERSALFRLVGPRSQPFAAKKAAIHCFFLRTFGTEIARIEVPEWVAADPARLDAVHAGVLADARLKGYPYTLAQAHQQVAIPLDVVRLVREAGAACYISELGEVLERSAKQAMKMAGQAAPARRDAP